MNRKPVSTIIGTACLLFSCITGCATMAAKDNAPTDLMIIDRWGGDFPVARLALLPEGQRQSRTGCMADEQVFAAVWQVLMPDQKIPAVDFGRHLVVFSRNVDFYNRTHIMKVVLADGGLEILAMETMSAMPIQDKVAMALAVVPRAGVKFIRAGDQQIPVAVAR
jgi:hypothetical protein